MTVTVFNNGWGDQWPLKQFEQQLVNSMIQPLVDQRINIALINSVWYTDEFHSEIVNWLDNNPWDVIVLVAMLDAAIVQPNRFVHYNRPVYALGYYPGSYQLDFCALFVDHFLQTPSIEQLTDTSEMKYSYMSLNRKPHWHRKRFYNSLAMLNILDQGIVSMGSETGPAVRPLPVDCNHDNLAPNASAEHHGIPNDIVSLGHLSNWRQHFLNIVTETFFDINRTGFVSEKIFKPILGCRPFLVYDPDGATQWLSSRGFESYVDDFQDITTLDLRSPDNIAPFLKILSEQGSNYWRSKYLALNEKILYNKNQFIKYVTQQKELVKKGIQCQV